MNEALSIVSALGRTAYAAAGMFWAILWALILGFAISGMVQVFVSKRRMVEVLGRANLTSISLATFFGAASSSCSYAAAAMGRTLFVKGADIVPALAFMLASTNLVVELGTALWLMLGWQFVVAEVLGALIMIAVMVLLMQTVGPRRAFEARRHEMQEKERRGEATASGHCCDHTPKVLPNVHEQHYEHHQEQHDMGGDMETHMAHADADSGYSIRSLAGWHAAAGAFVMDWQMIGRDILLGVVLAGALMVWVPAHIWQALFLQHGGIYSTGGYFARLLENTLLGPLVASVSFVCSVGNIPLTSVLYSGGIGFGGALSFIYADLLVIPLLLIYRRYYGTRLALWIAGILYVSMATTGIIVDLLFNALGWVPAPRRASLMMHLFAWNYTTWLNIVFLVFAAVLVWLARSGGSMRAAGTHQHHH